MKIIQTKNVGPFNAMRCWLIFAALFAAGCDGEALTGESCSENDDCLDLPGNVAACTDDGICIMSCEDGKSCLENSICMTDTVGSTSWSYCVATCSNPSGKQEDCPSSLLKCYEVDGQNVCLKKSSSILYLY